MQRTNKSVVQWQRWHLVLGVSTCAHFGVGMCLCLHAAHKRVSCAVATLASEHMCSSWVGHVQGNSARQQRHVWLGARPAGQCDRPEDRLPGQLLRAAPAAAASHHPASYCCTSARTCCVGFLHPRPGLFTGSSSASVTVPFLAPGLPLIPMSAIGPHARAVQDLGEGSLVIKKSLSCRVWGMTCKCQKGGPDKPCSSAGARYSTGRRPRSGTATASGGRTCCRRAGRHATPARRDAARSGFCGGPLREPYGLRKRHRCAPGPAGGGSPCSCACLGASSARGRSKQAGGCTRCGVHDRTRDGARNCADGGTRRSTRGGARNRTRSALDSHRAGSSARYGAGARPCTRCGAGRRSNHGAICASCGACGSAGCGHASSDPTGNTPGDCSVANAQGFTT